MNTFDFSQNRFFAAVLSLGATAILMAYAIVPATPAGLLA